MRTRLLAAGLLTITLLLSGCDSVGLSTGGGNFALPRRSDEFEQLELAIEQEMRGAEYAPPVSGSNRQAIQMEDLDGDGTKEAVVFLANRETGALRVCVFGKRDEMFELFDSVEVEGANFASISYADLTVTGRMDIVVGSSLGSGLLKALTVYSYTEEGLLPVLTNTYTGYAIFDINDDTREELLLVRHDITEMTGVVEVYRKGQEQGLALDATAALSQNVESLKRIRTGFLLDNKPAIFVVGQEQGSDMFTDIFAYNGGTFLNTTIDEDTGISDSTMRQYNIFGTDLNGDGIMDIPRVVELPPYDVASEESFFKLVWKNYSIDGQYIEICETFHNYTDGWYLVLPEALEENLVVTKRDYVGGERAIVFCQAGREGTPPTELFTLYTLTGDNREERGGADGRTVIATSRQDAVFAVKMAPRAAIYDITVDTVTQNFHLIQTEWMSGEITS